MALATTGFSGTNSSSSCIRVKSGWDSQESMRKAHAGGDTMLCLLTLLGLMLTWTVEPQSTRIGKDIAASVPVRAFFLDLGPY
jgi:hypothetical protein